MEMLEYRNSARGYVMALEDKSAMEGYLEAMLQGTTLKQKAYGILASSEIQAEMMEQLVSLPWKAMVLRYFEEEMRDCAKNTRSHGSTLRNNRVTTEVCLVPDGTDSRRVRFRRKEEVKRREGFPYDEPEGSDNPRGSSSSVCEAERRSVSFDS